MIIKNVNNIMVIRFLYLLFFCICFSCANTTQKILNKSDNDYFKMGNVYIGMPLDEFKESVPNNTYVLVKGDLSIFKSDLSTFIKNTDTISERSFRNQFRYYYFKNDELINIDGGAEVSNYRMGIRL